VKNFDVDEAYHSGYISREQYDAALRECDMVVAELCADAEQIKQTEILCGKILSHANDRIEKGEKHLLQNIRGRRGYDRILFHSYGNCS